MVRTLPIFVHVAYVPGSSRCDMLCTSGVVDDVIFSLYAYNTSISVTANSTVDRLTPLLHGSDCVLSQMTAGTI